MRWMLIAALLWSVPVMAKADANATTGAEQGGAHHCLLGVCLGDDVRELKVAWVANPPSLQEQLDAKSLMLAQPVKDIYRRRNELMVTTDLVRTELFPYVMRRQVFDATVLNTLAKVQAFCSSTTLTGEVMQENKREHVFVTFRVEPVKGGGSGRLRVVVLEKQFDIMSGVLRPEDRKREMQTREAIRQQYGQVKEVRDLDARFAGNDENFSPILMGYRFYNESRIPFTLRMRDLTEFELMEESKDISPLCKEMLVQ